MPIKKLEDQSSLIEALFAKRIILIDSEMTDESCSEWIGRIALLDISGKKPIIILVNSYGGDFHGALGLADVIRACACPTITVCTGVAQSGGSIVLTAASKRYAVPNAEIMLHQPWGTYSELTAQEVQDESRVMLRYRDVLVKYYLSTTKLTKRKIEAFLSKDTYMNAEDALKCGLIDDIGWHIHAWLK